MLPVEAKSVAVVWLSINAMWRRPCGGLVCLGSRFRGPLGFPRHSSRLDGAGLTGPPALDGLISTSLSISPLTVRILRRGEVTQTDQTTGWAQCVNTAEILIRFLHNDSRWGGVYPIRDRHSSGTSVRAPMDGLSASRIGYTPSHLTHHSCAKH